MMKIYKVVAQDLNNAQVIYFDTYENAYNWVEVDNWYFEKAIFEKEFKVAENGMIVEKTLKKFLKKIKKLLTNNTKYAIIKIQGKEIINKERGNEQ